MYSPGLELNIQTKKIALLTFASIVQNVFNVFMIVILV